MNTNQTSVAANSTVGRNSIAHSIRTLQVLGVPYWVEFGGIVYSSSPIEPEPIQKPLAAPSLGQVQKTKTKKMKAKRNFRQTGYREQMAQMKVGDVVQLNSHPYKPGEMQKAVCAAAHKIWGPGTYTTAVLGGKTLEVLRTK